MYYIELNSKIAEEAGEGHTIMSIYEGKLVRVPLPWRPNDGNFLRVVNVSEAFIVYHPVKERKARVLRGILSNNGIGFPDPENYPYKEVDYEKFKPYFEELSKGATEWGLSLPENTRFLEAEDLASLLSDVPEVLPPQSG